MAVRDLVFRDYLADVILMLYRDEVYNPDTEARGITEIHVKKNKHGRQGMIEAHWHAETATLRPLARRAE